MNCRDGFQHFFIVQLFVFPNDICLSKLLRRHIARKLSRPVQESENESKRGRDSVAGGARLYLAELAIPVVKKGLK